MQLLQLGLWRHRHATHSLTGIRLFEESAVAYHDSLDTLVGTIEECLQTATRHSCYADVLHVQFLIVRRVRVGILCKSPVNALNLLF